MRIEEKCGCGGALTLYVDAEPSYRSQADEAAARAREAWKQVDRWRVLHSACRRSGVAQ